MMQLSIKMFKGTFILLGTILILISLAPQNLWDNLLEKKIDWHGVAVRLKTGESFEAADPGSVSVFIADAFGSPTASDLLRGSEKRACAIITSPDNELLMCEADFPEVATKSPLTIEQDRALFEVTYALSATALSTDKVVVEDVPSVRNSLLESGIVVMTHVRAFKLATVDLYGVYLQKPDHNHEKSVELRAWGIGPLGGVTVYGKFRSVDQLERFFVGRE
jgi:hypothetical protein